MRCNVSKNGNKGGTIMDFGNRKVVFKALFGSHNYNLNDETSDKDYKYFVLPTFNDLYSGKMFSASHVGEQEDYDVHDIRKLVDLFWKANINFLEVLYSKERCIYSCKDGEFIFNSYLMNNIVSMRGEIVTMNLPYLYSACKGMYFEKMKALTKGTTGTQRLVDKYGYDTKQAMHAYRVLDFCIRFANNGFADFTDAMRYDTNEEVRQALLYLKHGGLTLEEFNSIMQDEFDAFFKVEPLFKQQKPNEETKAKLYELVKELVRSNL